MLPLSMEAAVPVTTANLGSGIYSTAKTVTITADNPSATIYYTTDGSMPTTASYGGLSPVIVNITATTILKFFAKLGMDQEPVKMEKYVIVPRTTLAAGGRHTLTIRTDDGTLSAWGDNMNGQLGLGDTTQRTIPTQVGSGTNWVTVTAGDSHTLAIKSDGTLWAWGANGWGRLGLGDMTQRTIPTQVGSDTTWVAVAAGLSHSIALKFDGTLW